MVSWSVLATYSLLFRLYLTQASGKEASKWTLHRGKRAR